MRKPNIDRKNFSVGIVLLLLLSFALCFLPLDIGRYAAAGITLVGAFVAYKLLKKKNPISVHTRGVLLVVVIIAVLYPALVLFSGLYFGFFLADVSFSILSFFKFILPMAITIVSCEIIRSAFIGQKGIIPSILAYAIGVIADVLMRTTISRVTNFYYFMNFVGMALLPALAAGLLYQYTVKRYGVLPSIIYRLIVTLFPYIVPIKSGMPDALVSFLSLLVAPLLLLFLRALYGKNEKRASKKSPIWVNLGTGAILLSSRAFVLLISCQFRFCLLIIATESMTGEINKGDAVIYEKFTDQIIEEDKVIVFNKDDTVYVHRVIDITRIDGENRYVTKGDANDDADTGYITDADIIGIVDLKVPYVGYPTLWLRQAFK